MRRLVDAAIGILLFPLTVFLFLPTPASAHAATSFYAWYSNGYVPGTDETYFVRSGFPSASAAIAGASVWNSAGINGREPDFLYGGITTATGNADNPCNISWSAVYWRDISGPGTTQLCVVATGTHWILNFSISIDSSGTSIYTGSGTPGGTQFDLQGMLAHEFGHATGFVNQDDFFNSNFLESDAACPDSSTRNTMCSGTAYVKGKTIYRTLDTHDVHTFRNAYP